MFFWKWDENIREGDVVSAAAKVLVVETASRLGGGEKAGGMKTSERMALFQLQPRFSAAGHDVREFR